MEPRLLPLGDAAAIVRFGAAIDPALNARAQAFCAALAAAPPRGLHEWAPAFASVTLWYDPDALPFAELESLCRRLALAPPAPCSGEIHDLPFCAEADFAPDLADVAQANGLSPADWLQAFAKITFDVAMLGFLPGFAYLGGLPKFLDAPRLATPRKNVPERSVAIADGMCAAYPQSSPGGWRLIGRTPTKLFDAQAEKPTLFAPGDRVRWRLIGRDEFFAQERTWRG
ncbi:KipI family sensor histidine kinase inhibitor [Rhodoblastus sphagnicola]|nr:allophanate hydrolase subunit 1 [Rhodoblastus sphagnicola]MBB4197958.1 KipI family sensor histidine kinase inhibitor [Rhodoblastus sphagnicola]